MVKNSLTRWSTVEGYYDIPGRHVPIWGVNAFSKTELDLVFLLQFTNAKVVDYWKDIDKIANEDVKEFYPQLN